MRIQWCLGLRFKMEFETEDASRTSWFVGTVSSVKVLDPIRWPNSPWRILEVAWDEPDLLQNVKHVSPWLVELVSNMPIINLPPFSPPRKKLSLPQDLSLDGRFQFPSFSGHTSFRCPSNVTAGIQGARHAHFGVPLLDLQFSNKLQSGLLPPIFHKIDADSKVPNSITKGLKDRNENVSCLLTMGSSGQMLEKADNVKKPQFLLFGQPILTEQQISNGCSISVPPQVQIGRDYEQTSLSRKRLSQSLLSATSLRSQAELGVDTDQCKVFLESEDVGRTLDLSLLGSYEELYKRLANMFGIERLDTLTHVVYCDATGGLRRMGDEPFSDFMKNAKRLTILMNSGSSAARKWITSLSSAERGLDSSNQAGSLSIFA